MSSDLVDVATRWFGPTVDDDPVKWAAEHLNATLWSKQQEVAYSVRDNRYTAVMACHDSGKSYDAAVLTCWWLQTHTPGTAFVVTTAPSAAQVEAILWREIERLHRVNNLTGQINMGNNPQWKFGKEMVAYGRKPADYDQVAFQGIHALYVLVIIDEADGVPKSLFDAIDALATNENARVLAIGNPENPASQFYTVCQPGSGWNTIRIDGLQSPNFTEAAVSRHPDLFQFFVENGIPFSTEEFPAKLRPNLLSVQWVAERLQRWGVERSIDQNTGQPIWKESALWQGKVRGVFPDESTSSLIPSHWIDAAITRWRQWESDGFPEPAGRRIYSCDVARYGDDETVVATRQGDGLYSLEAIGQQDTMTTAERLAGKLAQVQTAHSIVDVIGVGGGVVDRLRQLGLSVEAFNASKKTNMRDMTGEFKFNNTRSASWWHLRELLDPSQNSTLMLPPDEELKAELLAPRWRVAAGAVIGIEAKDAIKKRLGRSPDRADAVVMAFWASSAGMIIEERELVYSYELTDPDEWMRRENEFAYAYEGREDW